MGIDIYANWDGMTAEEDAAQVTGFDIWKGHVGYLREAYHGEPYATKTLVPEAFDKDGARIAAATLQERLPEVLRLVEQREREIYGTTDEKEIRRTLKSFSDFVELCERKENETGRPCLILASW